MHEGLPDYVAIEQCQSLEEPRRALGDRPVDVPMMQQFGSYPRYRLLVTWFLEKKRWPVDGLLATRLCAPVYVDDIREREELLATAITAGGAAEIRQLFVEFESAGVDFFRPLKQEPWGARTVIVRDPDGNLLLFAGTAT